MQVQSFDRAVSSEVGQPDTDAVTVGSVRQIADKNACDMRCGSIGVLKRCGIAGNFPADDVRIHSSAADLFSNLVHDEQIDVIQRKARHEGASFLKKYLFLADDSVGAKNP